MRMFSSALRSSRTWWRVVALLIAVPAVGLSWLGLRAVGTDALERERQIRDRQTRLAGLRGGWTPAGRAASTRWSKKCRRSRPGAGGLTMLGQSKSLPFRARAVRGGR
jgi:hypothetical protein